jgi:hypothetical protein
MDEQGEIFPAAPLARVRGIHTPRFSCLTSLFGFGFVACMDEQGEIFPAAPLARGRLLLEDRSAVYHVTSRAARGLFLFDEQAREVLVSQLHAQAEFCGVEVLAYCVMGNHFHLLVRVPGPGPAPGDGELLRRYRALYGEGPAPGRAPSHGQLERALREGGERAERARERLLARMGNLPSFVAELKQRFSIWYNHNREGRGALWQGPYHSVLVEDAPRTLMKVAAYIDLNPVRANLAKEPGAYRWCGYAAALAGRASARRALRAVAGGQDTPFAEALAAYRLVLFGEGAAPKRGADASGKDSGRIDPAELERVAAAGGRPPTHELLRARCRFFTGGVALGSREFLERAVRRFRGRPVRAHPVKGAEEGLCSARNLRTKLFG